MFKRYPKELRDYIIVQLQFNLLSEVSEDLIEILKRENPGDDEWTRIRSLHPVWTKEDADYIFGELFRVFERKTTKEGRQQAKTYRQIVMDRAKDCCEICGAHTPYTLEIHHIVSVEHGGHGYPSNLIAVCSNCHSIIHKFIPVTRATWGPTATGWAIDQWHEFGQWIIDTHSREQFHIFDAVAHEWAQFEGAKLELDKLRPA